MFSMTTEPITPPDMSAMSEINVAGVLISLGVGITVWLVASFVISVITKRIAAGSTFFKKPYFRWAAPRSARWITNAGSSGPTPSERCSGASWAS